MPNFHEFAKRLKLKRTSKKKPVTPHTLILLKPCAKNLLKSMYSASVVVFQAACFVKPH